MSASRSISECKQIFNKFFHDDLYGRFDNDQNIILSRGGWNDTFLRLPKIFSFCINFALTKHWVGYSDSLGHKNTLESLEKLVNTGKKYQYSRPNLALTIGNVITLGTVFRQLNDQLPNSSFLTLKPYYTPIIKSASNYFKKIYFISGLQTENQLMKQIIDFSKREKNKIIFLPNGIGVEGRTFSKKFWSDLLKITVPKKIWLVIDEGMRYGLLDYPKGINNENTVRTVSLSKKYGAPGCKLGYLVAGKKFIKKFYEQASTNYGGPLSIFFLLCEFIYQFEYIFHSGTRTSIALNSIHKRYNIPKSTIRYLYDDFVECLDENNQKILTNRNIFLTWAHKNRDFIDNFYDFGGINVFIKFKYNKKAYDIFLDIIKHGVSLIPSSCLGDTHDEMMRMTLLENSADFKKGLKTISVFFRDYEKTR